MKLFSRTFIFVAIILFNSEDVFANVRPQECLYLPVTNSVICINRPYSAVSTLFKNITTLTWIFFNRNITVLDKRYFRELSSLEVLNLKNNYLSSIKSAAFSGLKNLKILNISENFMTSLETDVFQNCLLLETIDLSSNRLSRWESFTFALIILENLKYLVLERNVLPKVIDDNDFRHLYNSSLSGINLANCGIETINPGSLLHLNNLQYLNLSGNALPKNQLWNVLVNVSSKLKILDTSVLNVTDIFLPVEAFELLSHTEIEELTYNYNIPTSIIKSGDFPLLSKLLKLSMKQCGIMQIEENAFKNLTSLEVLDLSRNFLTIINSAIYSLKNLRILDMSYNKFSSESFILSENNLENMKSLEQLFLNSVPIGPLKRYALNGLSNLYRLSLDNSIRSIEPHAFESLANLSLLFLTRNFLTNLHEDTFYGLHHLETLFLSQNNLVLNSTKTYFAHLTNLKILSLTNNKLTEIPHHDLTSLHNLHTLLIQRNQIIPWTVRIFVTQPKTLKILDLSNNYLNKITPSMVKDFEGLDDLDIAGNPFNCSECETYEFAKWLNTSNTISRINNTQCVKPENQTGKLLRLIQLPEHCINDVSSRVVYWVTGISVLLFVFGVCAVLGYYFRWFLRYQWFTFRIKRKANLPLEEDNNYLYDAFIAYNYKDGNWLTERLIPELEMGENRMKLCVHERDFEIGREIWNNVIESIERSRKIILLLSNDFLKSHWCMWEMNLAQFHLADGSRDALILILLGKLDKRNETSTLRFLLRTQPTLRWTENPNGQKLFFEKVIHYLRRNRVNIDQEDTLV